VRSHFYLVEHRTRGVYISTDYEWTARGDIPRHHFSWSKLRTDPVMKRFHNLEEAKRFCVRVPGTYVLEFHRDDRRPMRHVPKTDGTWQQVPD